MQYGKYNNSEVNQLSGNGNRAVVNQNGIGTGTAAGEFHSSMITQQGNNNLAKLTQEGQGQTSTIMQNGNGNVSNILQNN
jgi:hypothetical protein